MYRWEYLMSAAGVTALNGLGAQGWEAVGICYTPGNAYNTVLLKRAVPMGFGPTAFHVERNDSKEETPDAV